MKLINFVLFQLGWFIAVWGAAQQEGTLSFLAILAILSYHILRAQQKKEELFLLFTVMLLGFLFDQCLLSFDLVRYQSELITHMTPIWIVGLWGLFATTLNLSLSWLKKNTALAVLFGFIGGPLAYLAAERLDAVQLIGSISLFTLALGWAFMTPLCLALTKKWNGYKI